MKKTLCLNRRVFVKNTLQLCAGIAFSHPLLAFADQSSSRPLSFYHTHTGKRFKLNFNDIATDSAGLREVNSFLRDFRTGEVHVIDPDLFRILFSIQELSDHQGDIQIISGYRSPKTNKQLQTKGRGVAKKSLHMKGKALDVRFTGVKTSELRDLAISLKRGGVGYYPKSDFIHIDTGRVRSW